MKAQKLGLVLGMNMAVACLVFQGCKVTQPGAGNMPPPRVDPAISVGDAPAATASTTAVEPVADTTVVATPVATTGSAIEVTSTTEPAVEVQQPSQVAVVKPLPAVKPRPVALGTTPAAAPAVESTADAASTVVVQRGDTLSAICARNHVKMSAVVAANPGLNPNRIRVGQKIALPGVAATVATAPATKPAKVMNASAPAPVAANTSAPIKKKSSFKSYEGPTKEYKVRSGDMLGKIAYASGITVRALKEMNKLSSDNLKVGQILLIPAEKVATAKPATKVADKDVKKAEKPAAADVKKGGAEPSKVAVETPAPVTVAEPVQVPVVESVAPAVANDAAAPAPAVDAAAQTQAPVVDAAVAPDAAAPSADAAPVSSMTYTVKDGDDIVGVAIAWGISPSQLMDLNNLKAGEAITPGQVLKLPANAKQSAQ